MLCKLQVNTLTATFEAYKEEFMIHPTGQAAQKTAKAVMDVHCKMVTDANTTKKEKPWPHITSDPTSTNAWVASMILYHSVSFMHNKERNLTEQLTSTSQQGAEVVAEFVNCIIISMIIATQKQAMTHCSNTIILELQEKLDEESLTSAVTSSDKCKGNSDKDHLETRKMLLSEL